jgi:hypothetical protein
MVKVFGKGIGYLGIKGVILFQWFRGFSQIAVAFSLGNK